MAGGKIQVDPEALSGLINGLDKCVQQLEENSTSLSDKLRSLHSRLQDKITDTFREISKIHDENIDLKKTMNYKQMDLDNLRKKNETFKRELEQANNELEALSQNLDDNDQGKAARLQAKIQQLRTEIDNNKKDMVDLNFQIQQIKYEMADNNQLIEALENHKIALEKVGRDVDDMAQDVQRQQQSCSGELMYGKSIAQGYQSFVSNL